MTLRAVSPAVGGGPTVDSVNGQTGEVVLDASDVGAVETTTTANQVYGTTAAGAPTTYTLSTSTGNNTVVLRTASGNVEVATPTAASHATTKNYVDGLVRAQLAHLADATDATDVVTQFNALLADLIAKGYMAAA